MTLSTEIQKTRKPSKYKNFFIMDMFLMDCHFNKIYLD